MMTTAQVSQTSNQPVNQPQDIQIIPTGAALGAEIRGLDLSQPVP